MPLVRALRGVCIGVNRHLVLDETAEIDAPLTQYLVSIKAVEKVLDTPVKADPKPETPVKAGTKEK